jgi:hypothetical protein
MEDFPANSHNVLGPAKQKQEKPEKKEVEKVVVGEVIQKPRSIGRKFKDIFVGGQFRDASTFVGRDVIIPAIKNVIVDSMNKGTERIVYGDTGPSRRPREYPGRTSYNRPIERGYGRHPAMLPDQPPRNQARRRTGGMSEIIVVSRDEAELVVERLSDIIDMYDAASVADLHDLVGLPTTYIDNKWGWTSLQYADVKQVREGYLIDLPAVEPLS